MPHRRARIDLCVLFVDDTGRASVTEGAETVAENASMGGDDARNAALSVPFSVSMVRGPGTLLSRGETVSATALGATSSPGVPLPSTAFQAV